MAFFKDFDQRNKDQAYAKRCVILAGLLFTQDFFWSECSISTYPQLSKKQQKMLHNTRKEGEFSVAS